MKAMRALTWAAGAGLVIAAVTTNVWVALGAVTAWYTGIGLAWLEQGRRERENGRAWLTSHSK